MYPILKHKVGVFNSNLRVAPYACQGIETKNPFAMKGFFCYGLTE